MLGISLRVRSRLLFAPLAGAVVVLSLLTAPGLAASLSDDRAWELVSSGEKLGNEVAAISSRSHAAAGESTQLPAAFTFASLGGFADVRGTGIGTEYLSQRDAKAGGSGWSVHAITPPQKPLSLIGAFRAFDPGYQGEMSAELTAGTFFSWSPVTDAPNVAHVSNLYLRSDLRTPGAGSYQLLSSADSLLPAPTLFYAPRPVVAAASQDFQHVLFESRLPLTSDASGRTVKLYKVDNGVLRLLGAGPVCPDIDATSPCSAAGRGATALRYTDRSLSSDGERVSFTAPVESGGNVVSTSGASSKLFQLDDRGTPDLGDDATMQVNASEASTPDVTRAASFETADTDGSRIFFLSEERLTDAAGSGLYLWERQPTNEEQAVTVDATGGTFTLTMHAWPSHGSGTLANGSADVTDVNGSFTLGQTITGPGIPSGTTIVGMPSSTTLTLSNPATTDSSETLDATVDAITSPLAHDASAAEVQRALEALPQIGVGNVQVDDGPGGPSSYLVTFTGALAGVNVAELTADGTSLTGGAASATVTTTAPLSNLTLIASLSGGGVLGASEDGHRLYFSAAGQLVRDGPPLPESGIYFWQDADGSAGGTLSFVAGVQGGDLPALANASQWNISPKLARVTPDGRSLLFEVSDGSPVGLGYDHGNCNGINPNNNNSGGCSQVYVYRADTSAPTTPDLVCASCNPSGSPATANAFVNIRTGASAMNDSAHFSHALSDDGRYAFFSTQEALVPEDSNNKSDAYEYDMTTDTPHLISSGKDPAGSYFLDASADGHDVYFVTRERLVGWDRDDGYDAYDARIGGGFPEPVTPAKCTGDACQGQAQQGPGAAAIGSAALRGAGNARGLLRHRSKHKHRRCRRGHRVRRAHGRRRCVKTKRQHHAAATERRVK